MPSISVIVPVYKVEAYLGRCVDSILSQTFSDFELILVDDGSPDRCGILCDAYAEQDSRIHVIHQKNGGLSAARNSGIDWAAANSASQWLAFVDSDDWVAPNYLEQLYRGVSESGCQVSACGFFRTSGAELPCDQKNSFQVMTAEAYLCDTQLHNGVAAVAWNKLYHKSLFQALRYPVGKLHEDEFTTYKMLFAAGRISVTQAELYAYFQNPAGIMLSSWNPRRMHILEALEQQIQFAEEQGHPQFRDKAVRQYLYAIHDQLKQVCASPEHRAYRGVLRKKYRAVLKLGRSCGVFPRKWEPLWAYEEAYPCKIFWWLFSKVR